MLRNKGTNKISELQTTYTPEGLSDLVNKKSGVAGFSEVSSDTRDLEKAIAEGNKRAKLILDMYNYRIKKYIGAYAAAMGSVDILVYSQAE